LADLDGDADLAADLADFASLQQLFGPA